MWLVDVIMHVSLGADVHTTGFFSEILSPHPTALIFRVLYLIIAIAFGIFLWRANWRERELQALEQAVIAYQRQIDAPALRILANVRQLKNRNSIRLDETAEKLAEEIDTDANLIDELAKKYLEFSRLVQEGKRSQAIETLRSIEMLLLEKPPSA